MKYLLPILLAVTLPLSAQSFEWKTKSSAPAAPRAEATLAEYQAAYNERQIGFATEYGVVPMDYRTQSGERYLPAEYTAAHALLPVGTLVEITNLANNRTATVRINDNTVDCSDCLLKLSRGSAEALGLNLKGRVAVERTGFSNWNPKPAVAKTSAPSPVTYGVGTVVPGNHAPEFDEPVTVQGQQQGWVGKEIEPRTGSAPATSSQVVPAVYQQSATTPSATSVAAPPVIAQTTVFEREVVDATTPVSDNPADYVIAKSPAPQPVVQQQPKAPTVQQAAPPSPTVPRYQAAGPAPQPQGYGRPATQPAVAPVAAPVKQAPASTTGHVVQLAAYSNEMYARKRVAEFTAAGLSNVFYQTFLKDDGSQLHRVYVGPYQTRAEAQQMADAVRTQQQIAGVVTQLK